MDTLTNYRQIIEKILKEYAALPYAYGELERELIIDKSEKLIDKIRDFEREESKIESKTVCEIT